MMRPPAGVALDTDPPLMAGRTWLVTVAAAAMLVTTPSRAAAQEHIVDLVGGVAATGTSADQSTLAMARVELVTPRLFLHGGWNIRGIGEAGWEPLFTMRQTTPEYRDGTKISGGFRLAHTSARLETALVGQIGSTHVDDWSAAFEAGIDFRWIVPLVDLYAGLRHDNRLPRSGALSNYRDPTGRALLSVSVVPVRVGHVVAGVAFESETALPGKGRLPSGVVVTAVVRY